MTMSAISHYRGGTIDVVAPVAKKLKAAYLKHGIVYRLSRFETGASRGDWLAVVQYDQSLRMPSANRPSPRLQSSRN